MDGISRGVKTKGLKGFAHDISLRELEAPTLAKGLMKNDVMPIDKKIKCKGSWGALSDDVSSL